MVSVYMEGNTTEALVDTMEKLHQLIQETRNRIGTQTDVILAGGISTAMTSCGEETTSRHRRQGEADPITNLIRNHALHSLLP